MLIFYRPQLNQSMANHIYELSLHDGITTIKHFVLFVNEVEIASIDEVNTNRAIVLKKRHGKSEILTTSYRTNSWCPFIAKALDIYLGDLSEGDWSAHKISRPSVSPSCHCYSVLCKEFYF